MFIKHQFTVDLFQLKYTKNQEGLLKAMKESYAREFGMRLVEEVGGYVKQEEASFKGVLPEFSANKDHGFTDLYEIRLCVLTSEQRVRLIELIKSVTPSKETYEEIIKLLS